MPDVRAVDWDDDAAGVVLLDQTRLPAERAYVACRDVDALVDAIDRLVVRGAPALGVAGAYGVAIAVEQAGREDWSDDRLDREIRRIRDVATDGGEPRPWRRPGPRAGARRAGRRCHSGTPDRRRRRAGQPGVVTAGRGLDPRDGWTAVRFACSRTATPARWPRPDGGPPSASSACSTARRTRQACTSTRRGRCCRARDSRRGSSRRRASTTSSRPTARRLRPGTRARRRRGRGRGPHRAQRRRRQQDRDAGGCAGLPRRRRPFVVAAPASTVDAGTVDGGRIPIELRPADEVLRWQGRGWPRSRARGFNPAFDVTPWRLVDAIVTEHAASSPTGPTSWPD